MNISDVFGFAKLVEVIRMAQAKRAWSTYRRPQATAVGSFLPNLTKKAFQKYGFSTASLLTDWAEIVGRDIAKASIPERIKWPRIADPNAGLDAGEAGRQGATLVLRVDAALALDIQYQGAQIKERINAYFGYKAVSQLRLIQAPIAAGTHERHNRAGKDALAHVKPSSTATGLMGALSRLEENIRAEG